MVFGSGDLGTWLWEVATEGSDDLCHRLLMVAWDVFWGGCRSAKLCVFPLIMAAGLLHGTCFGEGAGARNIVAAAGDEGQLVCV